MVTQNVFIKMEGLYYDLGTSSLKMAGTGTQSCTSTVNSVVGTCTAGSGASVGNYTIWKQFNGVIANLGVGVKF